MMMTSSSSSKVGGVNGGYVEMERQDQNTSTTSTTPMMFSKAASFSSSSSSSSKGGEKKNKKNINGATKRLLSRAFSRVKDDDDDDDDDDINNNSEEETEDEHELLSSSTPKSTTIQTTKRQKKKKKKSLTPARGSLWSPRRDNSPLPTKKSSSDGDGTKNPNHMERGEDVITQFLGDDEPTTIHNREAEMSSSTNNTNNTRSSSINSSSGRGNSENSTSTTVLARKRNIFARFFGACFGGANASSFNDNNTNTKQQRNIRDDAKAPLRKEEKAPTVAGCVPVPCLKPQFSNVVGEGFTLHTGAYFLPAPETYRCAKSGNATSKPCLVLDLDETLVHSSFRPIPNPDYIIPVEIDGRITDVYVLKRPWVDLFLIEMAEKYELVVFTASLAKYANPLMDKLDVHGVVRHRLFRDACYPFQGNYVKDLTCLGRDLRKTIIIDNSPYSYMFHPQNALPVSSFIDDPADDALFDMLPHLYQLAESEDVTVTLYQNEGYMPRARFYPTRMDRAPAYDRLGNKI